MSQLSDQRKLGQALVDRGLITAKQLDDTLEEQRRTGRFIGELLVSRDAVNEEQVTRALSEQLGFAFVDLSMMTIEPKALELIPEKICSQYTVIPLFIAQNTLTVAMANPLDVKAIDEMQAVSNCRVKAVFACPTAIRYVTEKKYHQGSAAQQMPAGEWPDMVPSEQIASLKHAASLAPIVNMVNNIITKAVEMGASDIHLEPERSSFNCRTRIDGILYQNSVIPFEEQAACLSRIKIMANLDITEKRLPQDGRIRMTAAGREVDLRVSTFPTIHGENVVIRILDRSGGILKLKQIGLTEEALNIFLGLIHKPYGMILITGPTGSGKTTTLYAALGEINSMEKNVITLEDPVEYEIPHIRQSQVNIKAGLTFAAGLRAIVRQDPDIIMIGEIRDKETADIAIHAALTGHLVFSTLHTNDAPSACTRLIDMGVEPFLVASSVIAILAQRLLRTLCPSCKQPYAPSAELLKQMGRPALQTLYKEAGCNMCKERGYMGRSGIYELLIPTDRIRDQISQKASAGTLREEAIKAGMKTLRDTGMEKAAAGATSISELLRVTEEV